MDKHEDIKKELVKMGQKLGFLAFDEIGAGQEKSSWPDVVWYDSRIRGESFDGIAPISQKKTDLLYFVDPAPFAKERDKILCLKSFDIS